MSVTGPNTQIMLEYGADRRIVINQQLVTLSALEGELRRIFTTRRDKTMFIAGAGSLRYADIVAVIDAAERCGSREGWDRDGEDERQIGFTVHRFVQRSANA